MKIAIFGEGVVAASAFAVINPERSVNLVVTTEKAVPGKTSKLPLTLIAKQNGSTVESVDIIDDNFISRIEKLNPDLILIISFGFFIPKKLRDIPKFPMINIHPSNLPKLRGAAPIIRAIEAGSEEINVCVIEVTKEMDAGDIFARRSLSIDKNSYASDVYAMAGRLGGEAVLDVLEEFERGVIKREKQNDDNATFAAKVKKFELLIDFSKSANTVMNKMRALDVCGGCYFLYNGKRVKVWRAEEVVIDHDGIPGGLDQERGLIFCGTNAIRPLLLQREGKGKVLATDFWNGLASQKNNQ